MSNTNTAISCAILMVNDEERKDYFDNFVPLILECIRVSSQDIVSTNEVQKDLENLFGISIPLHVIDTILKRRLVKKGQIKIVDKKYIAVREELEKTNFKAIQLSVLEHHDKLINDLINFVNSNYQEAWSKDVAENALESFLVEHNLLILKKEFNIPNSNKLHFKLANYITSLDSQSISYTYLESIIQGNALANAIYFTEPSHLNMKFKNTEIYFDTSFIIYALGYAGEARQAPCLELLDIIKNLNGITRCFKHSIQEIVGILDGIRYRMSQGTLTVDSHGTIDHFVNMHYSPADIERFIYGLENEIEKKLKIRIVDKPPYEGTFREHNIDEQALNVRLQAINYKNVAALNKDVDSISAIMRLRKSNSSMYVESCKALFITTNNSLVDITNEFFYSRNGRLIPPVLPSYVLTNLLWLKNPTKAPSLTRKRIIADCYASVKPRDHLWKKYIEKAESLLKEGKITSEEYYTLRSSPEARRALMEITHGDGEVITFGSIEEILQIARHAMVSETVKDYEEMISLKLLEIEAAKNEAEIAKTQGELSKQEVASAKASQNNFFESTAKSRSKMVVKITKYLIVIILVAGQGYSYFMLNLSQPMWLAILIFSIFVLYFPVTGFLGISLNKPFEKLESLFYLRYKKSIQREFFCKND